MMTCFAPIRLPKRFSEASLKRPVVSQKSSIESASIYMSEEP